jgi:hypothetical protein
MIDTDTILESFYEAVLEADAKGRQAAKRAAVSQLVQAGMTSEAAKNKVQSWFEAVREQQKQA